MKPLISLTSSQNIQNFLLSGQLEEKVIHKEKRYMMICCSLYIAHFLFSLHFSLQLCPNSFNQLNFLPFHLILSYFFYSFSILFLFFFLIQCVGSTYLTKQSEDWPLYFASCPSLYSFQSQR